MKKIILLLSMVMILSLFTRAQDKFPQVMITNRLINAKILMPDTESGYYRSTRFDWSGVIESLSFDDHTYFGQWFDKYDPLTHDAIMGPVEEFGPLGYDEAATGGDFVKIGVGVLLKPEEEKYNRFNYYRLLDYGTWKTRVKKSKVSFNHRVEHKDYGYEYEKTVKLIRGKPVMEIVHSLKNNGQKTIETNVYNHNFFVIDKQITGPGLNAVFTFDLKSDPQRDGGLAEITGNWITFRREFVEGDRVNLGSLTGFSDSIKDYDIRIENHNTGAGVRITGDKPISRLVFWASLKVLSPEPYIDIRIEPGQEFKWVIRYEFYTLEKDK